jgi:hypothetical protein
MNQRCAWCNVVYGTKEPRVAKTSHGACPACQKRFLEKLNKRETDRRDQPPDKSDAHAK